MNIGKRTYIHPSAIIYDNVTIGNDCIINAGAVIGAEGFSTKIEDGKATKFPNKGGVIIGDGVDIGANTCVDRATLEDVYTIIGDRVLIDNLVHVAHNVVIGNDTRIAPMVCIGGSCIIGERVWISIGCSLREHLTIGDDAVIMMGAVVIADVPPSGEYGGFYAMEHSKWKRFSKILKDGLF